MVNILFIFFLYIMESVDNKMEDIFFSSLLKNRYLNSEIFKIYDLINTQNISEEDKIHINEKIFWYWLSEENHEIIELLDVIRHEEIRNHLVYKLIFELVEDVLDVDDKDHLDILLSEIIEEIETDMIYFLRDILELVYVDLKKRFSKREGMTEFFKDDYMSDKELSSLFDELDVLFIDLIINIKNSDEKKAIEDKIRNEIEVKKKIFEIK